MNTILLFDGNNLFHKNYHTSKKYGTPDEAIDMSIAYTLMDMKNYYEEHTPLLTIAAFDSKTNWRKEYTRNTDNRVTDRVYKANRGENLTKKERLIKKLLDETIQDTAKLFKDNTKIPVLWKEGLEVDDMASGICRIFGNSEYDIKIVSSDKDFLQFFRYNNVELINPLHEGKSRNISEWNNDPELFIFEKCIRGDRKDNVRSSYPRVRKTKIVEAYYDEFKKVNLMNHSFEETVYDEDKDEYINKEYRVGDLFEENKILLDLNSQPEIIREEIDAHIEEELSRKKCLNFIKFLRFCKKRQLENLVSTSQNYIPFLSNKKVIN